jgi:glucokinase
MNVKDQTNKELTFTGNEEEIAKQLNEQRDKILNDFAKAYLAETQLLPSQIELIQQQIEDNGKIGYVWYFKQK